MCLSSSPPARFGSACGDPLFLHPSQRRLPRLACDPPLVRVRHPEHGQVSLVAQLPELLLPKSCDGLKVLEGEQAQVFADVGAYELVVLDQLAHDLHREALDDMRLVRAQTLRRAAALMR